MLSMILATLGMIVAGALGMGLTAYLLQTPWKN